MFTAIFLIIVSFLSFLPSWIVLLCSALCLFLDVLFVWRLIKS